MAVAPFIPDRFDAAVAPYVAHRLRYDPRLLEWMLRETGSGTDTTVLDLGCGPGFISNAIAPMVGQVFAVDPSEAMLNAGRVDAPSNVTYLKGSSFDLSIVPEPFQLVTMGRAFHWMDRVAISETLDGLLPVNGSIALLADSIVEGPVNAWFRAANTVARAHSVVDDCGKLRHSDKWTGHDEILMRSAFSDVRRIAVHAWHSWTLETFVGYVLSRSGSTEALIGDRLVALTADLTEALYPFGPGPWTSLHAHHVLIARRP